MTKRCLAVVLVPLLLSGCSLDGDSDQSAAAPPFEKQVAPAPPSSPASGALEGDDAFALRFKLRPPRAGIVFDLATGDVLWRRRPLEPMPVASLTKVVTALVVTTMARPSELVRIHADALRYTG